MMLRLAIEYLAGKTTGRQRDIGGAGRVVKFREVVQKYCEDIER